ncbi:hypothetical protein T08_2734 [Trichinella sp. T8]|nr:hypothetical protein T08_2734 [Trichinella sp. T8]
MFIYSVANPLQGETKWECTKCELSPCHQKGYLNNGIVEVPEETDCREVTVSPVSANFKKYLPSGYAWGYASGKIFVNSKNFEIFKKIAAGYAPGYASGNFKKIFTLRLRPRLCLRQIKKNICPQAMLQANLKKYLPSGYAWGYASGKIFAMPQANLKKYLPSGYAWGYASGKIFEIFKKIAAGYAPGYASGNLKKKFTLWLRPRP